ncbi:glycosyltransferase [Mycoplana dimorpha]|uniref:Glycosyl transferase family 1 n=1 Tax=Mycoplana dimorpha TaxID=28320 RepID=A0A2T5BE86_MYCDI|nr:glycosyltransferase [Mycoplana dimorpha]PTM97315.1 glycosyl transferase family 1 [Mycoplana dimorpha]
MLYIGDGTSRRIPGSDRDCLLCFSHLRWRFVFQRPQHLMTLAARQYRVLYIEEPIYEPNAEAGLRAELDTSGVEILTPVLPLGLSEDEAVREQAKLTRRLLGALGGRVRVCWYYTPMAYEFSDMVVADIRVYDCMDELSAFKGAPRRLSDNERRLLAAADLVFTGGQSLFQAKRRLHPAVHAFPSSVDQRHFRKARRTDLSDPSPQACLERPRVGFFGVIDERMDLELVEAAARLRPDFEFVLVGPVTKISEASLPRLANLHWLGRQEYRDLPDFVSGWDVAFMPFALNRSTRFISPTKTPEFLAAGVPVVSTPVPDVVRPYGELGLVRIAHSPESLVTAVEACLNEPRQAWLRKVDDFLAGMSWEKTWAQMHKLVLSAPSALEEDRSSAIAASGRAGHA